MSKLPPPKDYSIQLPKDWTIDTKALGFVAEELPMKSGVAQLLEQDFIINQKILAAQKRVYAAIEEDMFKLHIRVDWDNTKCQPKDIVLKDPAGKILYG